MKLSKFESVGEVILVKEPAWSTVQANLNQFCDLKDGDLLYTKKVAQEYAKECVREAIILNSGSAVSDDMIKRAIDSVFTEDTKNESR
ncbi:hypothetical protein B9W73_01095 [Lactococcus lactis]|uniref:hypothetical protein n=1 Tax=Lactococcus lactis TaxID=1358 RepID=UPI000A1FA5FF|nr:hypothetical protein [Lactococcus lactis]OSP88509.1 hypothetical protein B9W73_01095 [Lactococcus lactis]